MRILRPISLKTNRVCFLLREVVSFRSVFSLSAKMLNSIKKIENKNTVVQENLVSLQNELSVLKTKFATENNNNNNNKKVIEKIEKEKKKERKQ